MQTVLHIASSLKLGGAERVTIDLASIQILHGLRASIMNFGHADDVLVSEAQQAGVPVTTLDESAHRLTRYFSVFQSFKRSDVIHFHSYHMLRYLAPVILFFKHKTIIYTRHGHDALDSFGWRMYHKLLKLYVNHVTFVTSSARDVFSEVHHWNFRKLHVIENGVPTPKSWTGHSGRHIRFGSVGRMAEVKGQRYLISAANDLFCRSSSNHRNRDFSIHFIGQGPLETDLKSQASALGEYGKRIVFHGLETDRDRVYSYIDVLIVSSETEGLSLAILEAMARGIPVIATDVGGNSTLVSDTQTGFLVPYADATTLANTMLRFIEDPKLVTRLGGACRELIETQYSLGTTHVKYLELYE